MRGRGGETAAPEVTDRMRSWATEFKQFLLRGNVIDLAVAIVIGTAFAALVQAAVADLLTPLVAAIFGQPDFSALTFTVNGSTFRYGHFLNVLIAFVTIAFVVFFFVVKPINRLMELSRRRESPDPSTRKCPECVSEIPIDARRCAFCTSEVAPV
jgi:large conductance mechanosensitive channel